MVFVEDTAIGVIPQQNPCFLRDIRFFHLVPVHFLDAVRDIYVSDAVEESAVISTHGTRESPSHSLFRESPSVFTAYLGNL